MAAATVGTPKRILVLSNITQKYPEAATEGHIVENNATICCITSLTLTENNVTCCQGHFNPS